MKLSQIMDKSVSSMSLSSSILEQQNPAPQIGSFQSEMSSKSTNYNLDLYQASYDVFCQQFDK